MTVGHGQTAEFLAERGYRAANLGGGIEESADHGLPLRTPDDGRGKVV